MENPVDHEQGQDNPRERGYFAVPSKRSRTRQWLGWMLFAALWFVVYSILPDPLDTWIIIVTVVALAVWLYNRLCGRIKLPPLEIKFEKFETISLTHILLALLLLVMLALHSDLANLTKATIDVQDSVTDLQNSTSEHSDDIKSGLDDVKGAIEANQ